MSHWKQVQPEALTDNVFQLIGKDWMLITAGNETDFNTMTASWGGFGVLWHEPVATVYVRPTRHTDSFMKRYDGFTLSFFADTHREALNICGTLSGRDVDKVSMAGLHPAVLGRNRVTFDEARLVICCRKVYADRLRPENCLDEGIHRHYPKKDYHHLYIGFIESIYQKE